MSVWTETHDAILREQVPQNVPFSFIARLLNETTGSNFTRSAVIGRANRVGIKQSPRPKKMRGTNNPNFVPRVRRAKTAKTTTAPDIPLLAETLPFDPLGLTFMQLRPGQCRYPYGDGPFLFCGQPVQEGSSYCPNCHAVTHAKAA